MLRRAARRRAATKVAVAAIYRSIWARRREGRGHYVVSSRKRGRVFGRSMQCYVSTSLNLAEESEASPMERIERLAAENAVVVFSVSTCCMCHVVKRLFCSLGVSPTVYELDEEIDGQQLKVALAGLVGDPAVPAVFVGGKLVGGLDSLMATHISGALVPLLKEAGALWL